jgi:hypothetical protein
VGARNGHQSSTILVVMIITHNHSIFCLPGCLAELGIEMSIELHHTDDNCC